MPEGTLGGLLLVVGVAFAVPLLVGLVRLPVSVAALELVAGAALGPAGLGVLEVDPGLEVLAGLGLAFTLLLAGLETDLGHLRAMDAGTVAASAVAALVVALAAGAALAATGLVGSPLLVAVALWSTSPGVAGSVAEVGAAAGLVVAVGAVGRVAGVLRARQEGSSQLRVCGALLVLVGCLWTGQRLGVSSVLAVYAAGVVLRVVDRHPVDHPRFRAKLEAAGHGVFTPIFLVVTGAELRVGQAGEARVLGLAALLLGALLLVHGAAALVARLGVPGPGAVAATLLGATTLPLVVAAVELGLDQGVLTPSVGSALVLASLVGFAVFPVLGLRLLVATRPPEDRHRAGRQPGA